MDLDINLHERIARSLKEEEFSTYLEDLHKCIHSIESKIHSLTLEISELNNKAQRLGILRERITTYRRT